MIALLWVKLLQGAAIIDVSHLDWVKGCHVEEREEGGGGGWLENQRVPTADSCLYFLSR